jgi:hypothetical protein
MAASGGGGEVLWNTKRHCISGQEIGNMFPATASLGAVIEMLRRRPPAHGRRQSVGNAVAEESVRKGGEQGGDKRRKRGGRLACKVVEQPPCTCVYETWRLR